MHVLTVSNINGIKKEGKNGSSFGGGVGSFPTHPSYFFGIKSNDGFSVVITVVCL